MKNRCPWLLMLVCGGWQKLAGPVDNHVFPERLKIPGLGRHFYRTKWKYPAELRIRMEAERLHGGVVRAARAFWRNPGNVLGGVLDITGFAVDAVLGIDSKTGASFRLLELINSCRAKALFRSCISRVVGLYGNSGLSQLQVDRLVFLMVCT